MIRCVNIDWLEVFVLEIGDRHNAEWFRQRGVIVHEREFGTRIYHEMFTLEDGEGHPFIEVRREPKNPLMDSHSSHLRFVNRSCYYHDACRRMREFIDKFDYLFQRISRIDICLDLIKFDDNTLPRIFMQRYMRGKFSKINQANIHSHGSDRWTGRVWNSVSWGSPSSMVGTKFYNKTLELYDPKTDSYAKPWILYSWFLAGLIDNPQRCTLKNVTQEVWRIEFSIKSSVKNWFTIELDGDAKHFQSIRSDLFTYDTKDKLLCIFASLCGHYFHFKRYVMGQRKDRCPDRVLFRWHDVQQFVEIQREAIPSRKAPSHLLRLVRQIRLILDSPLSFEIKRKLEEILHLLEVLVQKEELSIPYNRDELLALQLLMKRRTSGFIDDTFDTVLAEVKRVLHINDKTAIF